MAEPRLWRPIGHSVGGGKGQRADSVGPQKGAGEQAMAEQERGEGMSSPGSGHRGPKGNHVVTGGVGLCQGPCRPQRRSAPLRFLL